MARVVSVLEVGPREALLLPPIEPFKVVGGQAMLLAPPRGEISAMLDLRELAMFVRCAAALVVRHKIESDRLAISGRAARAARMPDEVLDRVRVRWGLAIVRHPPLGWEDPVAPGAGSESQRPR